MLIFLRHAERGDNQFPTQMSEIEYDPPITTTSHHTTQQTGRQLAQLLKQEGIQKVKFISSKFLRCLMTTEQVSNHLISEGINVDKKHEISHEICEYMRQDWFNKYPLENLIFDREEKSKYLGQIDWHQTKRLKQHPFPENYVMFHERIGRFHDGLSIPPEGECTIFVTHGFVVREMCWRFDSIVNISGEVKYCGYAAIGRDRNRRVLLKSHL